MATADDILSTAEVIPTDHVFVIDNDLREITIPEGVTILGVESDDDVRRVYFSMPSIYCGFDLSEFDVRINYLNANNEGDVYAVQDAKVESERINFSWLVGRTAAAYHGDVKFIVCLKRSENGEVVQEFNTTVASLPVLEGLETSEAVVQAHPDILENILKRLDDLEQTGGVSDEQIGNAVNNYLTENPIEAGATAEQAAQIQENKEAIEELQQNSTVGGITEETDPTVPEWAKAENKPTYTAEEVGALPNTTVIPTVPSALPNPQPLVINGVTYDGSEKKEITIQADDGGIVTETDPTVPDWAKAETKPTYTAEEIGALPDTYEPPVKSVNGQTGVVVLGASDVGALPDTTVIPTVPETLPNPYPLTINGVSYDGSAKKDVTIEVRESNSVELDTTLSVSGKAADAKATGDALAQLNEAIDAKGDPTDEQIQTAVDSYLSGIAISGISAEEKAVFLTLFKAAAYTSDVSSTIAELEALWGGTVEPDEPVVPTTYTITNTLTNATSDNATNVITEGGSYTATITADEGYMLTGATVSITMGGTDITADAYADGVITIASVTGDVVIAITAVEEATEDLGWTNGVPYTIDEWTDGYTLDNSTGAEVENSERSVSEFIPCSGVSALVGNSKINGNYLYAYDADKTYLGRINFNASYPSPVNRNVTYVRVISFTSNKDAVELTPHVYAELNENTAWVADTYYSCGSYVSPGSVSEKTGVLGSGSGTWWRSDYLNCYGASNISIVGNLASASWRKIVVFYDADKNYISGTLGVDDYGTVPENSKYFVVSGFDGFEYTVQKSNRPWIKLT